MNGSKILKAQRIQRAKEVLGRLGYANTHAVAVQLADEFKCCLRTAYAYAGMARADIIAQTKICRDEHIASVLASLEEMVLRSTDDKVRLKALEMKSRLLGLNAAKTINLSVAERPQFAPEDQKALLSSPELQELAQSVDKVLESRKVG